MGNLLDLAEFIFFANYFLSHKLCQPSLNFMFCEILFSRRKRSKTEIVENVFGIGRQEILS